MTEEIKYIANLQRQEEFDNEVTELKDELKRLEQENEELKSNVLKWQKAFSRQYQINENKGYSKAEENYRSALEEVRECINTYLAVDSDFINSETYLRITDKINEVLGE